MRPFLPVLGVLCLAQGCIIIVHPPTNRASYQTRGRIPEETQMFLVPGATSREDVLADLGEPELTMEGERVFIYHWKLDVGDLIAAAQFTAVHLDFVSCYYLFLRFDRRGILVHHEQYRAGGLAGDFNRGEQLRQDTGEVACLEGTPLVKEESKRSDPSSVR